MISVRLIPSTRSPRKTSGWVWLLSRLLLAGIASLFFFRASLAAETDEWLSLAEGVFARVATSNGNSVSNAGVVLLDHGVVVFDTHFTSDAAQALLARIRSATGKPVQYVVNSHYHPDHTHGNSVFSSASCLIATGNTRRDILLKDLPVLNRTLAAAQAQLDALRKNLATIQEPRQKDSLRNQIAAREQTLARMSNLKIPVPVVIVDDSLTIEDGRELRLLNMGSGHSDGDLVMYLPSAKVAFVGDLFFNRALPNTQDANLLTWIKTLGELQKLDAEKIVPGHGPVGNRQDLSAFLQYLLDLKASVEPAVERGDTLEQVLREVRVPEKYANWDFQNFFPANLQLMYQELKAQQPSPADPARKPEAPKP
jgi:cyclase